MNSDKVKKNENEDELAILSEVWYGEHECPDDEEPSK